MKIGIGADHGGYELKEEIKKFLEGKGVEVVDYGTHSNDSVDYPVYSKKVSEAVANGDVEQGVLICGTGLGMSYVANKVKGVRCACVSDTFSAEMAKVHNDANIIAFGARVVGLGLATKIVEAFLGATFEGGRHQRRVDLINKVEEEYFK